MQALTQKRASGHQKVQVLTRKGVSGHQKVEALAQKGVSTYTKRCKWTLAIHKKGVSGLHFPKPEVRPPASSKWAGKVNAIESC